MAELNVNEIKIRMEKAIDSFKKDLSGLSNTTSLLRLKLVNNNNLVTITHFFKSLQ